MNIALLLSGGTGTRMGSDIPKQYMEVDGRPIISYCIERLSLHARIDAFWIVADADWHGFVSDCLEKYDEGKKFRGFSMPGENRQLSILNGLMDIRKYAEMSDCVLIHDAARPLVTDKLISDCFDALDGHDGALPVLPMKDTVYCSEDGRRISSLIDRSRIYAGQAPEVFRLGLYYEANRRLLPERILEINGSTEPAVMAGMAVAMFAGDENNFKITTRADLERLKKIVRENGISQKGASDESNGTA